MKDLQVFKRGQVWYVNDNRKNIGHIQGKSRPYLVVSNDKCNTNSPVIHMAPITTQDKTDMPTHVTIYDPYRRNTQTILVEQTMPKSVPDISPIAEYRYTLTEEKMIEVDKALAVQFGIQYGGVSMDDFEELLDMIKEQKIAQIRAEAEKINNARASAYVDKMMEAVDSIKVEPAASTNETKIEQTTPTQRPSAHMSQVDKFNLRLQKSAQLNGTAPQQHETPTKSRNRWTDERKREFLEDVDNPDLDKSTIMKKYGISGSTYNVNVCKFRKELGYSKHISTNRTNISNQEAEKFLADYDTKPISEVVAIYNLPDKKAAVELASKYRIQLGR